MKKRTPSALGFLRAIHAGETGFIEFRLLKGRQVKTHYEPLPLKQMPTFDAAGFNIYFGVAPRYRKTRGKAGSAADVTKVTALWADVDWKCFDDDADRAVAALDGLQDLAPSAIVNSGNGYHAYWLLNEPVDYVDAKATLEALRRRIHPKLDSVSDAPRILRVPETFNLKEGHKNPSESNALIQPDVSS